jgi:hypothetical protein
MAMNFVSYNLCKLLLCLMCFQMFFVCINQFLQFTFSLNKHHFSGKFKSVKEGFYCILKLKVCYINR